MPALPDSKLARATCLGAAAAWAVLLLTLSGCSGGNNAQLSGLVSLDGEPLADGSIGFRPLDGKGPTAEAIISAGRYEVTTLPGRKQVVVHGRRKVGTRRYHEGDPSSPLVDVHEETLPERYHAKTELTAEVKLGSQQMDFPLTSAAAK